MTTIKDDWTQARTRIDRTQRRAMLRSVKPRIERQTLDGLLDHMARLDDQDPERWDGLS